VLSLGCFLWRRSVQGWLDDLGCSACRQRHERLLLVCIGRAGVIHRCWSRLKSSLSGNHVGVSFGRWRCSSIVSSPVSHCKQRLACVPNVYRKVYKVCLSKNLASSQQVSYRFHLQPHMSDWYP